MGPRLFTVHSQARQLVRKSIRQFSTRPALSVFYLHNNSHCPHNQQHKSNNLFYSRFQVANMTTHASEFTPSQYPPMPRDLPTVELETISLSKLQNSEEDEQTRLFDICKNTGFFYLDLSVSTVANLAGQSEEIARLSEDIFRLDMEEKEKYLPQPESGNTLFGYKNAGRTITDKSGTPDTAEFFNISKTEMISSSPALPWPKAILDHKPLLKQYITSAHETGLLVLRVLSQKLNLPADTLSDLHRITEQSGDHIRMTRGPPRKTRDMPEIQTPGHTDFGTVTILFNWLGGLQIWSEGNRGRGSSGFTNVVDPQSENNGTAQWLYVVPKPRHAIVNLGDAAVKFTNGLLCSGRHRVIPAPGDQGRFPRYSVVYFVRPEDKAVLRCLESPGVIEPPENEEEVVASEWIKRQVEGLKGKEAK